MGAQMLVGNAEEIRREGGARPRSMGKAATEDMQLSMAIMCARTVVGAILERVRYMRRQESKQAGGC